MHFPKNNISENTKLFFEITMTFLKILRLDNKKNPTIIHKTHHFTMTLWECCRSFPNIIVFGENVLISVF